jgi:uncharacterized protein (TIRG00374 family)
MKRTKLIISFGAGFAVSLAALYFSFRKVPLAGLSGYLAGIHWVWLVPTFLVLLFAFVLRVIRWRIILHPVARLSFWECFHPMMIGFMMNCILPARVGELARPAILRQRHGATFFGVLATVAAERVLDLLGLLTMFVITMQVVGPKFSGHVEFAGHQLSQATLNYALTAMVRLAIVLVIGIAAVSVTRVRVLMERIIMGGPSVLIFLPRPLREKIRRVICGAVVGIMEKIAAGFGLLKSPLRLLLCLVLTAGVWLIPAYSYVLMTRAAPGINLGFPELTAVMVIVCVFISLPSAPGFWGLWEAGGIFALAVFGVSDRTAAAGYTLAVHLIQMAPAILVGFFSAAVMGINVLKISGESGDEPLEPRATH